jgi:hypothetical protein
VTCFNVSPDFASSFKFWKSRGASEFNIKYLEAAFDKEAGSGEFFFEFDEKVWEHKLIENLRFHGACQVMTSTFTNNDGNESASNALLRVFKSQEKTNIKHTRGTCPPALIAKIQAKKAAEALSQASSSKEFDEKTMAAMRQSLALQEETKAAVVKVEGGLESVKDGIQSQVVKLEGIEHGVCNVIPDYQKEIALLKSQLTHKTALCDRIEGQKGRLTYEINRQKFEIAESIAERESLRNEKKTHLKTIQDLQEQLDMCKGIAMLKQMMDETQHTTEILLSTLADERENKRQRGV